MKEYKLPIGCDVPETIILADGDFPSHPLALEWLRQCPYYKPQNKMFRFYKTFCSKITLVNTIQNVILNPI